MLSESEIGQICIDSKRSIRDAVALMTQKRIGIALVTDQARKLQGTITDGDVRRAVLKNINLDASVSVLLDQKKGSKFEKPIVAQVGQTPATYAEILTMHRIFFLPLVNEEDRIAGLVALSDLMPEEPSPVQAVVMAGGKGTRLYPLTQDTPKPMLPVGDRPLLEHTIVQLRDAGIQQVNVTTHYKADKITQHFGDGSAFGVQLNYVSEDRPLGTAGALGLIDKSDAPLLVVNGDILTGIDFRAFLAYHQEHQADLTVAVRQYDVEVPYGVVACEGANVVGVEEKPVLKFFVNAGIYMLQPSVRQYIPNGDHFDMTQLVQRLLDAGRSVVSFPIREYWLDIGQPEDYERAQADMLEGRITQ